MVNHRGGANNRRAHPSRIALEFRKEKYMELTTDMKSYRLPREFWAHMMQVREVLLRVEAFRSIFVHPDHRDNPIVRSFWFVETWATAMMDADIDEWEG